MQNNSFILMPMSLSGNYPHAVTRQDYSLPRHQSVAVFTSDNHLYANKGKSLWPRRPPVEFLGSGFIFLYSGFAIRCLVSFIADIHRLTNPCTIVGIWEPMNCLFMEVNKQERILEPGYIMKCIFTLLWHFCQD